MKDESENNQGYEHMLDFQMSWVMRVAANKDIQQSNPVLYKRCFDILMKLIEKTGQKDVEVQSVKVWKQWKRIDVIAEVEIQCDNRKEKHLVVLEDKAYTMIHDDQLNRYEAIVNNAYDGSDDQNDFKKHFWVITFFSPCEDGYKALESMCDASNAKWKLLSYDEVTEDDTPTGSEHFDDFWIYEW